MGKEEFEKSWKRNEARQVLTRSLAKMPHDLQKSLIVVLMNTGKRSDYFRTCVTCLHWNAEREECKLYNVKPPIATIVDGCEKYEDFDEIPF